MPARPSPLSRRPAAADVAQHRPPGDLRLQAPARLVELAGSTRPAALPERARRGGENEPDSIRLPVPHRRPVGSARDRRECTGSRFRRVFEAEKMSHCGQQRRRPAWRTMTRAVRDPEQLWESIHTTPNVNSTRRRTRTSTASSTSSSASTPAAPCSPTATCCCPSPRRSGRRRRPRRDPRPRRRSERDRCRFNFTQDTVLKSGSCSQASATSASRSRTSPRPHGVLDREWDAITQTPSNRRRAAGRLRALVAPRCRPTASLSRSPTTSTAAASDQKYREAVSGDR